MKKVAFYGRYSSSNQTEQSIEGQLHVCEQYAAENDLQIAAQYTDRAISGKSDNRPQFQKMIADSASGAFHAVLVYKLDRFARNRYDSALYKKKLRDNGVRVISATEQITDSPEGIIMEGLLEAMDEYYSAELARKMKRGIHESVRKGKFIQKTPPFGYKLTAEHTLALDPDTAPISAEIFRRYDAGETIGQIAAWLNGLGFRKASGKPWSPMNVSRHLHHTVCKGEYHYGDFEGAMPCPAVVDAELFDRVQERLSASAQRRRKRGDYSYLLTGKLVCAHCGRFVCGTTSAKLHYYKCRICNLPSIRADYLHEKVLNALAEYLTADKVSALAAAAYAEYSAEQPTDTRPALEKEIRSVEAQLQNATQAILRGVDLDILSDTVTALKAQREALRASLADAGTTPPQLTEAHFRATLSMIADMPGKDLLDTIVNRVILNSDSVIICINLTDESNDPPLEQIMFKISESSVTVIQNITFNHGWLIIAA